MNQVSIQVHVETADAVHRQRAYQATGDGHTVATITIAPGAGQHSSLVLHSREAAAALAGAAVEALAAWNVAAVEDEKVPA